MIKKNGFTMIEMIIVIGLMATLVMITIPYFGQTKTFRNKDTQNQIEFILKTARKYSIAQRRTVYVIQNSGQLILCYTNTAPCPATQTISNQGSTIQTNISNSTFTIPSNIAFNSQGGLVTGVTTTVIAAGLNIYIDGVTGYVYE